MQDLRATLTLGDTECGIDWKFKLQTRKTATTAAEGAFTLRRSTLPLSPVRSAHGAHGPHTFW